MQKAEAKEVAQEHQRKQISGHLIKDKKHRSSPNPTFLLLVMTFFMSLLNQKFRGMELPTLYLEELFFMTLFFWCFAFSLWIENMNQKECNCPNSLIVYDRINKYLWKKKSKIYINAYCWYYQHFSTLVDILMIRYCQVSLIFKVGVGHYID